MQVDFISRKAETLLIFYFRYCNHLKKCYTNSRRRCRIRIMVITPASQAGNAGSIPACGSI